MIEITPTVPEVIHAAYSHLPTDSELVHTNLNYRYCVCTSGTTLHIEEVAVPDVALGPRPRPNHSGNSCRDCGGMMVRTGTCETCTECGSTGGCG